MLLLFGTNSSLLAAEVFHYRHYETSTGKTLDSSRVRFEPAEDTITLYFESGRESFTQKKEYLLNKNYETLKWHDVNTERSTDYTGERVGKQLQLKGRFNGKPLDKNIKIDDAPFLVVPKYELIALARSQRKKPYTFWAMRDDTLEVYKMIASYRGE
jgi:hypothetical protein